MEYREQSTFTYTNISAVGYPKFQRWCDIRGFHCRMLKRADFPEGQPDYAYVKDRNGKLHTLRKGIVCVETKLTEQEVIDIESKVGSMTLDEIQ